MFEFVRKHNKIMMFVMFLLIVPAFVLVGVDGYSRSDGSGSTVAKIASYSITQSEWDAAHKNEVDRLRASRPELDVKMMDSPEARYVTLERLVRERVMTEAADASLLPITDARLARELQQIPAIASMKKPDGSFDKERYEQIAASQGLTTAGLEARIRQDLSLRQLESGVSSTAFAPKAVADMALNAFFERREVQVARFSSAEFAAKVQTSDADIEAFYKANSALFQAPETADVQYLVFDLEAVRKSISVPEADVRTYYEQNIARLQSKEERRASHILISAAKELPAADREKAKVQAQDLLDKIKAKPDSFAQLAAKFSQDPGSAANGGDLNFFARGAMVKPFEDSAFALKKGETSGLVESDFGYHIIRLTDIKTPAAPSFDSMREKLEVELKTQQAQKKFAEQAEVFTNAVYEQADNLQAAADRLKLNIQSANGLPKTPTQGASGPLANAKLLAALFSAEVIEKKHNTEAIETGPSQMVAARISKHYPARTKPLDEVMLQVKARLVQSRAQEMAKKEGEAQLADWKKQADEGKLGAATVLGRDQPIPGMSQVLMDAMLRADTSALPAWLGVDLGAQGYAVARVNKVLPRNAPQASVAEQERGQMARWLAGAEWDAYYEVLKKRFKVQIKVAKPKAGEALAAAE
jgi:peptidyl-prolyl cis-trans isomerase D